MPSLWKCFADLQVRIDDYTVARRELRVSEQFTRVTTTVVLRGGGETGQGEDVTYTAADHEDFPAHEQLAGTWTLNDYSVRLDELTLWQEQPQMEASVDYRRWAFESAALDLALRQAGRSFADVLALPYRPVRFVASTRADITPYRENDPALEFKLDVEESWDSALMERLAATDRVRVLDHDPGKRLDDGPVQLRIGREVDAGAVVVRLQVEHAHAVGGGEPRHQLAAPVLLDVELELESRVERAVRLDVGARRGDEAHRPVGTTERRTQ